MNDRNSIILLMLTAFLSVMLTMAFFFSSMLFGYYGKGAVASSMNRSRYADLSYNSFYVLSNEVLEKGSIYEKAAEKSLSKDVFQAALKKSVEETLQGKSGEVDDKAFSDNLTKEINAYLNKNKVKSDSKVKTQVRETAREITGYFRTYATFEFGRAYYMDRDAFITQVPVRLGSTAALAVIISLLMMLLFRGKEKYSSLIMGFGCSAIAETIIYIRTIFMKIPLSQGTPQFYETFIQKMNRQMSTPYAVWMFIDLVIIMLLVIRYRKWEREN